MARTATALLAPEILVPALGSAFAKLDPRALIRNPVMFVVEVVAILTTVLFLRDLATGAGSLGFSFQIVLWQQPSTQRYFQQIVRIATPWRRADSDQ